MRPHRPTIFEHIDRINHMRKWNREEKKMQYYDKIATIAMAIIMTMIFIMAFIMILTIFGV
ncbi:hypothetical protein LCGC14_1778980 [marine sediment metagenome]|uniref:Uncharacterized protein n=1 Tax=marine sediment metagenome TaxID=412755 RepID=A0A0F9HIJ4_9ZZZZ